MVNLIHTPHPTAELALPQVIPCGPCCRLGEDWRDVPRGVHASVMDADSVVDYWVYVTREDDQGFVDEYTYRLSIGAGCGLAADMIRCWLNQYLPGSTLVNYAWWESYLANWGIEDQPF